MENKNLSYGLGGLLLGIVVAWMLGVSAVNTQNYGMMRMMGMRGNYHNDGFGMMGNDMSGVMQNMTGSLDNKTGDDFDKAFLAAMIVHHEGAVDMATTALAKAKHQEIKDLAKAIIGAQTQEIGQMKAWQAAWYK